VRVEPAAPPAVVPRTRPGHRASAGSGRAIRGATRPAGGGGHGRPVATRGGPALRRGRDHRPQRLPRRSATASDARSTRARCSASCT
jgi:hypothetical protein